MLFKLFKKKFISYNNISVIEKDSYAIIQLNRPKSLNALCDELMKDIEDCLVSYQYNDRFKSMLITGNEKAFAAGADIKQMAPQYYPEVYKKGLLASWSYISKYPKPLIAAIDGYALGGGFELALMCDILIASNKAKFGLPEITLGTIPGGGGTQRLIKEVGKSKAMQMILTGEFITSEEALKLGIISEQLEQDKLLQRGEEICSKIGKFSSHIIKAAKDCINTAYELPLNSGIEYERRVFWATFATKDREEGMKAFIEKRKPNFTNE